VNNHWFTPRVEMVEPEWAATLDLDLAALAN
jgi:hypothetical protein